MYVCVCECGVMYICLKFGNTAKFFSKSYPLLPLLLVVNPRLGVKKQLSRKPYVFLFFFPVSFFFGFLFFSYIYSSRMHTKENAFIPLLALFSLRVVFWGNVLLLLFLFLFLYEMRKCFEFLMNSKEMVKNKICNGTITASLSSSCH